MKMDRPRSLGASDPQSRFDRMATNAFARRLQNVRAFSHVSITFYARSIHAHGAFYIQSDPFPVVIRRSPRSYGTAAAFRDRCLRRAHQRPNTG